MADQNIRRKRLMRFFVLVCTAESPGSQALGDISIIGLVIVLSCVDAGGNRPCLFHDPCMLSDDCRDGTDQWRGRGVDIHDVSR